MKRKRKVQKRYLPSSMFEFNEVLVSGCLLCECDAFGVSLDCFQSFVDCVCYKKHVFSRLSTFLCFDFTNSVSTVSNPVFSVLAPHRKHKHHQPFQQTLTFAVHARHDFFSSYVLTLVKWNQMQRGLAKKFYKFLNNETLALT